MLVLGIETSCDETAAALVDEGNVLSNVIASQIDLHARFGGIVPEVASRKHVEVIGYVIREAFDSAGKGHSQVDAIAVTSKYGLIGSLIVGVSAAKAMAYALRVPLIGIHHIEGHIFANILSNPGLPLPHVCLTVSGGHTMLIHVKEPGQYEVLGGTLDDAAGEAFDKIAKFLGLGFPGGPAIEKLAGHGNRTAINLPRPLGRSRTSDFSFSGLKTAVMTQVRGKALDEQVRADLARAFQDAVVDVLVAKSVAAIERTGLNQLVVAGGVGANRQLRAALDKAAERAGFRVVYPELELCTDNGAMIALAGALRLGDQSTPAQTTADRSFTVRPRWDLATLVQP